MTWTQIGFVLVRRQTLLAGASDFAGIWRIKAGKVGFHVVWCILGLWPLAWT